MPWGTWPPGGRSGPPWWSTPERGCCPARSRRPARGWPRPTEAGAFPRRRSAGWPATAGSSGSWSGRAARWGWAGGAGPCPVPSSGCSGTGREERAGSPDASGSGGCTPPPWPTGPMAGPPTWTTWCSCATPTTASSTRAGGGPAGIRRGSSGSTIRGDGRSGRTRRSSRPDGPGAERRTESTSAPSNPPESGRRPPMRRMVLGTVAAFAVAMLAAGSGSGAEPTPGAEGKPSDVLFLRTSDGVALVQPDGSAVSVPGAVPAIDWSAVVRAVPTDDGTRVEAVDPASGDLRWTKDVPGTLEVKIASAGAEMVALGDPREGAGYAFGRTSTRLVLLDKGISEPRTIELDGNYAPEAFSTDGTSLFVVEYLPPQRPTSYRVRRLDLATERVEGVYTVDQELQDSMQGTARIQAASPDGGRLYTLYSEEIAGGAHTFVHVLSLDELWAHCIDLPASFQAFDERGVAISVTPDGARLYVADAASGVVAEADTETLAVTRPAVGARWPDHRAPGLR